MIKKVILTPNPYRDGGFKTVLAAQKILNDAGIETRMCLPFEVDKSFVLPREIRFSRLDRELNWADMVICFGGDGTILHMAKAATRHRLPILGVNIGTMGFIAELESGELSELTRIARGEFTIDNRMMLDVTIRRGSDVVFHDLALNDVTVTKGAVARIVHLNVCCDGVRALDFGGDGIVVSTPTGSTAYSLSAGGPIVEPDARSILLTPICAHDIVSKCIVASDKRTITVSMAQNARRNAFLSVDGGRAFKMNMGDTAVIVCSRLETRLVRLKDRSFYDIINNKFKHGV